MKLTDKLVMVEAECQLRYQTIQDCHAKIAFAQSELVILEAKYLKLRDRVAKIMPTKQRMRKADKLLKTLRNLGITDLDRFIT